MSSQPEPTPAPRAEPVPRLAGTRLPYPDVNAVPWPLNHHAYVRACVDRLRKEVRFEPMVHLPTSQIQLRDSRRALVRLEPTLDSPGVLMSWDEQHGWARLEGATRKPLVLGAEPLLPPEAFAHAVTALLSDATRQLLMVADRSRSRAHPVDVVFERRLAAYRAL
ncbi:hypothetical protein [Nocardiopsis nanhaiensis]